MATSNGLIGNFRGKLGNIVGYQYIDANGHAVQAIRAYRPDVFNPKTLDQAQQRIKITNSVAFYKAYASLLSRSYEDRKNAHACYCRQQSLAMSMIYGETPAVPKGRRGFVPAFYIVAEGSLPERSVLSVGTTAAPQSFTTSLQVSITINNATTLGELSQDLVDNNLNLLDGDTLYFMYAVQVGTIYFNPAIVSLTLDTASSTPLVSVLSPVDQLQSVTDDSNILRLGYRSIAAYRMSQPLAGAALIQSRGSGSSHLNYSWSSSMMLPSDTVIASWYSQEAFDQAIPSYLPPIPAPSDLTLNQSGTNSGYEPEPPEPPTPPLPYDAKIEYIKSDGNQIIDLGIKANENSDIFIEFMVDSFSKGQRATGVVDLFGATRNTDNTNKFYLAHWNSGPSVSFSIGPYSSSQLEWRQGLCPYLIGVRTTARLNWFKSSAYGLEKTNPFQKVPFETTGTLFLLKLPDASWDSFFVGKLYACHYTDANVELDLIPVRKDGIGYMYDRVSGQLFGNAGTGSFILGPDI